MGVLRNIAVLADTVLQVLAGLAALALSARLLFGGWSLPVRWPLFAYLTVSAIEAMVRFRTLTQEGADFAIYAVAEPLKLGSATWLFWVLTNVMFSDYPAIGSFVRKASKYLLPACAGLGAISFLLEPSTPANRSVNLQLFLAVVRAVTTGLLGFLVVVSLFSVWFPVRLTQQVRGIMIGFLAILGSGWAMALIANTWPWAIPFGNLLPSLALLGASVYWLASLWARERSQAVVLPRWDPERLARMTGQLDALQAHLARRGY